LKYCVTRPADATPQVELSIVTVRDMVPCNPALRIWFAA
jgi:hypothetical protein